MPHILLQLCLVKPGHIFPWPSGCWRPFSCVVSLFHSFIHLAHLFHTTHVDPLTTESWAISRTTHNQKITGGSRGGPLSTGVLSHKSSMRKNHSLGCSQNPLTVTTEMTSHFFRLGDPKHHLHSTLTWQQKTIPKHHPSFCQSATPDCSLLMIVSTNPKPFALRLIPTGARLATAGGGGHVFSGFFGMAFLDSKTCSNPAF